MDRGTVVLVGLGVVLAVGFLAVIGGAFDGGGLRCLLGACVQELQAP